MKFGYTHVIKCNRTWPHRMVPWLISLHTLRNLKWTWKWRAFWVRCHSDLIMPKRVYMGMTHLQKWVDTPRGWFFVYMLPHFQVQYSLIRLFSCIFGLDNWLWSSYYGGPGIVCIHACWFYSVSCVISTVGPRHSSSHSLSINNSFSTNHFLFEQFPKPHTLIKILSPARGVGSPVKPVAMAPTKHGPSNPLVR